MQETKSSDEKTGRELMIKEWYVWMTEWMKWDGTKQINKYKALCPNQT